MGLLPGSGTIRFTMTPLTGKFSQHRVSNNSLALTGPEFFADLFDDLHRHLIRAVTRR